MVKMELHGPRYTPRRGCAITMLRRAATLAMLQPRASPLSLTVLTSVAIPRAVSTLQYERRACTASMSSSEVGKAQSAVPQEETIFDKIIRKEIPAQIVFEDEKCLAFKDINPKAPVHVLVIPKRQIVRMQTVQESDSELLGHLMVTASKV